MAKAAKRVRESTVAPEPMVSPALTDRIPADGEQVEHTLNPNREPDTVVYRDPDAPTALDDGLQVTPQSNAEIQMERRTDAGPKEAASGPFGYSSNMRIWAVGAVALLVVLGIVIAVV